MNKITTMLVATVFASQPISLAAQTENPRGIYKMVKLVGNLGEIDAPFEQYKICSDSNYAYHVGDGQSVPYLRQ